MPGLCLSFKWLLPPFTLLSLENEWLERRVRDLDHCCQEGTPAVLEEHDPEVEWSHGQYVTANAGAGCQGHIHRFSGTQTLGTMFIRLLIMPDMKGLNHLWYCEIDFFQGVLSMLYVNWKSYTPVKSLEGFERSLVFSPRLHLFNTEYRLKRNIVKYYYWEILLHFANWIYYKM